jgi:hypothetical protein
MTQNSLILPQRLTRSGVVTSIKVLEESGQKMANLTLKLSSGKTIKARLKNKFLISFIMSEGPKTDCIFTIETLKGKTNWVVGIQKK